MRSDFLLDGDAISGREPVGEKGEQFEGCQAGVGGVDVGIRLNLRFGSTLLAGALRWFLRVRNALAPPQARAQNATPSQQEGLYPGFRGFSLCARTATTTLDQGGIVATTTVGVQPCQSFPPSLWLQNYTAHRKKLHPV